MKYPYARVNVFIKLRYTHRISTNTLIKLIYPCRRNYHAQKYAKTFETKLALFNHYTVSGSSEYIYMYVYIPIYAFCTPVTIDNASSINICFAVPRTSCRTPDRYLCIYVFTCSNKYIFHEHVKFVGAIKHLCVFLLNG